MNIQEFTKKMTEQISKNKKNRFNGQYNTKIYKEMHKNTTFFRYIMKYGAIICSTLLYLIMICDVIKPDLIRPKQISDFSTKFKIESEIEYFHRIGKTEKQIKISNITDITTDILKITPVAIAILTKSPLMYISYSCTYITETVLGSALRVIVKAPRPDDINNKTSFPSGHAIYAFGSAITLLIFFIRKKYIGITSVLLATIICCGRVLANRHFAIDVLCGGIIGCGCAIFCYALTIIVNNVMNLFNSLQSQRAKLLNINSERYYK